MEYTCQKCSTCSLLQAAEEAGGAWESSPEAETGLTDKGLARARGLNSEAGRAAPQRGSCKRFQGAERDPATQGIAKGPASQHTDAEGHDHAEMAAQEPRAARADAAAPGTDALAASGGAAFDPPEEVFAPRVEPSESDGAPDAADISGQPDGHTASS